MKTTISTYEQRAIDFLEKNKIEFKSTFTGFRKHFQDDKEKRNTYECTFIKRSHPIKELTINFGQSIVNTEKKISPTAYDVLTCITKYDPCHFEDFCGEFGYDEDSRKALLIYESVVKEWRQVKAFFTSEELNELREIQ